MSAAVVVSCDMVAGCSAPVAYIGEKGYAYCATHGRERASFGYERCRKLAPWELAHLRAGRPLLSYAPITKAEDTRRRAAARLEALRVELRAERISWGELAELQSLASFIDPSDVELLEAAGVPEYADEVEPVNHAVENATGAALCGSADVPRAGGMTCPDCRAVIEQATGRVVRVEGVQS